MIVDTSAILAILFAEPEAERLLDAIERDALRLVSTMTVLETAIVLEGRHGQGGTAALDSLLASIDATIIPFDEPQLRMARMAATLYGKGRHRAALNFGDCAAYALSRTKGEPLLCKGKDFPLTDVARVNW